MTDLLLAADGAVKRRQRTQTPPLTSLTSMAGWRVCVVGAALLLSVGSSCRGRGPGPGQGEGEGEGEGEEEGEGEWEGEGEGEGGFDDHTVASLSSVADFEALAASTGSSSSVKIVVTRFGGAGGQGQGGGAAVAHFLDSSFFSLHDEWYWFRLLNGVSVDGLETDADQPSNRGPFESVRAIYDWADAELAAGRPLPLDLRFLTTDERLYSPRFYDLALYDVPRSLGVATVVRFHSTAERPEDVWALELEFTDPAPEDVVRDFLDVVTPQLPEEAGQNLKWITRSLAQSDMAATFPPDLRARIISYADVVTPGQTEVYSPGTTAGRVLMVRRGDEALLQTARASDVLVVDDVPDLLPPCAALITNQPQTALAHVNLLARNRGIPNAFRAGVVDDANLDQLARVRAPVVVQATLDGGLRIQAITEADFATWRSLTQPSVIRLPPVDLADVDSTIDLSSLTLADARALRPVIGGKCAGFVGLISAGVSTVDAPVAITIKPYIEHLTTSGLASRLESILDDRSFAADRVVRRIVLEGEGAVSSDVVAAFKATRPPGSLLRDVVDGGGVVGIIRATPMAAGTLSALTDELRARFGRYAPTQGLRFRSSSTMEDAEGFNGAGLYASFTGYLDPPSATDPTVEDAVRETWASYWGTEAFEERRLANAVHLTGAMAVVVHANFPDAVELNNGVALFTILPSGTQDRRTPSGFVLEVNQQAGAHSVTNPPPGSDHLPEIDRVVVDVGVDGVDGAPRIERVRGSSLLLPGAVVLDDGTLLSMFDDARATAEGWLADDNGALSSSKRRSTLTLDFESRTVAAGWPSLRSGVRLPSRLVWKQARTLEPAVTVADDIAGLPIPLDVLARTKSVDRTSCVGDGLVVTFTDVSTDAGMTPDMGFADNAFVSFVLVETAVDQPAIGMVAGGRRSAIHTAFASVDHPSATVVDIRIDAARQSILGLARVAVDTAAGASIVMVENGGRVERPATCTSRSLHAAPGSFLEGLLD